MTGPLDRAWDCDRCKDVGFVYDEIDDRKVRRCDCRRGSVEVNDPEYRLAASRLPPLFRSRTLGNFAARTTVLVDAYRVVLAYCEQFPHGGRDKGLGLLFWGGAAADRTHLAAGVMMELIANRGVSARYWDFAVLLKEIGRSYDKNTFTTEMDTLRSAIEVDVLLLNDLASRRMPDWAYNTLFEIIDARYRERRPTLITTEHDDGDARAAAAASITRRREFLVERIGCRIRSRLQEMCVFIPMESPKERDARRPDPRPSTLKGMRQQDENRSH